jgi:hypothetical protein
LANHGLFEALETMIEETDDEKRYTIIFGIIAMILEYDPSLLRSHILLQAERNEKTFADHLINAFHTCTGGYLVGQLTEVSLSVICIL